MRFEEAAEDLNDYRVDGRKSLSDAERNIKKHLAPFFGSRRMAQITTADVRHYASTRQKEGAANGTINRELAALRRMFRLAVQAGKLMHGPYIALLHENSVRRGFFEWHQFDPVRRHLPEDLRGLVTFSYFTGWRVRSEILPLMWPQVDRRVGDVHLEPGTTKTRTDGHSRTEGLMSSARSSRNSGGGTRGSGEKESSARGCSVGPRDDGRGSRLSLIRFGGHLPKGEYDVDHDGDEGQADAAELHG